MSSNYNNDGNASHPKSSSKRIKFSMAILLFLLGCTIYAVSDQPPTPPVMSRQMTSAANEQDASKDRVAEENSIVTNEEEDAVSAKNNGSNDEEENSQDPSVTEEGTSEDTVVTEELDDSEADNAEINEGEPSLSESCEDKTQCVSCQTLASDLKDKSNESKTCSWDNSEGKCSTSEGEDGINPIQCSASSNSAIHNQTEDQNNTYRDPNGQQNQSNESDHSDEDEVLPSSMGQNLVLVFGFCLIGFVLRKKVYERFNGSNNSNYPASNINQNNKNTSSHNNIFGSQSQNPEHVPLSSRGSDDWDWDDGEMGDVELSTTKSQADDDLEMALALSLSVPKKKPPKNTSPIKMMAPTPARSNDSWDNESGWEDDELDDTNIMPATSSTNIRTANNDNANKNKIGADLNRSTSSVSPFASQQKFQQPATLSENDIQSLLRESKASHVSASSQITSLGPIAKPQKTIAPPPQKEEEDIFASMGFSSSFNKTSTAPKSAAPKSWNNPPSTSSGQKSNSIAPTTSMLAADERSDSGSLWDDDDDLDDLLDE